MPKSVRVITRRTAFEKVERIILMLYNKLLYYNILLHTQKYEYGLEEKRCSDGSSVFCMDVDR